MLNDEVRKLAERFSGLHSFVTVAAGGSEFALKCARSGVTLETLKLRGRLVTMTPEALSPEDKERFFTDCESRRSIHGLSLIMLFAYFDSFYETVTGSRDTELRRLTTSQPADWPGQWTSAPSWDDFIQINAEFLFCFREIRNALAHGDGKKRDQFTERQKKKFPNLLNRLANGCDVYPGAREVLEPILLTSAGSPILLDDRLRLTTLAAWVLLDRAILETGIIGAGTTSFELRAPFCF